MLLIIFSKLDAYSLGKASIVCQQWRNVSQHPKLWEQACHEALHLSIPSHGEMTRLMKTQYKFSWKRMFIHHPHLRFDGVYVGRNTYVKAGVVEFTRSQGHVHLVTYYRYFRFFPDGTLLYRTSPQVVGKLYKTLLPTQHHLPRSGAGPKPRDLPHVLCGRYILKGHTVYCAVVYPNSTATELRVRVSLRSTHPGANNRLDMHSIVTFDRELGTTTAMPLGQDGEGGEAEADPHGAPPRGAKAHSRGLAPAVFVPWEAVLSSPLNLPPHQMDYLIA